MVQPYVTGQVFTDGGRYQGDWVEEVNSSVLGDSDTVAYNAFGAVDSEGRAATAYLSAARTATPTSYAYYSRGAVGLAVTITTTAETGTPSVVATIDGYDPASDTWYNLLTSAAISTVSVRRLVVHPTIAAAANLAVATVIPEKVRVVMTHGNSDSITYTVSLDWMS